mmetsp:Transcript_8013/g.9730  ORF Transcript_8013/g.9730 Transcript_8013/m.9730 type:complete len:203 (+) Transcript_8013:109-717(+)
MPRTPMAPPRVVKGRYGKFSKEAIRRECLERIKKDREAQIWRRRTQKEITPMEEDARRVLDQVLAQSIDLSPDDEAELMAEIQAELLEFEAERWHYEADSFAEQIEAEARNLENAVSRYEKEATDQGEMILCPICNSGYLQLMQKEMHSCIQCNFCFTCLADGTLSDGLSLGDLRNILAQTYENHSLTVRKRNSPWWLLHFI